MPEVVPVPVIYPRTERIGADQDVSILLNGVPPLDTNLTVYFTINGDKPIVPTAASKSRHTIKYAGPFRLSAGKRHTVRAVAQPQSKRAAPSTVATKYFLVVSPGDDVDPAVLPTGRSSSGRHAEDVRHQLFDADTGPGTSIQRPRRRTTGTKRGSSNTSTTGPLGEIGIDEDDDEYSRELQANEAAESFLNEQDDYLEDRRWNQISESAACDLCGVPWPEEDTLYCAVCGYRRPESIAVIAEAKESARKLEPGAPLVRRQSPPTQRSTKATGLMATIEGLASHDGAQALSSSHYHPHSHPHSHTDAYPHQPASNQPLPPPPFRRTALAEHERLVSHSERRLGEHTVASEPGNDGGGGTVCPGCRTTCADTDRVCMRCGTQLLRTVAPGEVRSAGPATAGADAPGMVRCLACNKFSPQSSPSCLTCDASLAGAAGAVPATLPTTVTSAALLGPDRVMVCMSCSKANPKGSRFCNWCGFKAPLPAQQVQACPTCATENPLSSAFCSDCGGEMPPPPQHELGVGDDASIMALYGQMEDGSVAMPPSSGPGGAGAAAANAGPRRAMSRREAYQALTAEDRHILEVAHDKRTRLTSTAVQTALYFPSAKKMEIERAKSRPKSDGYDRFATAKVVGGMPRPATALGEGDQDVAGSTTVAFGAGSTTKGKRAPSSWRHQIDHAFVALKTFTRSKSHEAAKFQAQMMDFALGDVTSAELRQDGDEAMLTVTMVDLSLTPHGGRKAKRHQEMSVQTDMPPGGAGDTLPSLAELGYGKKRKPKSAQHRKGTGTGGGWSKLSEALVFELGPRGEGRAETVLGLIDEGADVNAASPGNKERPLNVAAEHGRVECLKFLLDAGAQPDGKSGSRGETALHSAVRGRSTTARECIEVLLDAGADPSKKNLDMQTPAALADALKLTPLRKYLAAKVGAPALAALTKSSRF
eukprot:m.195979 g.195979  ORF g.195979 m.195979 type:complete len:935 (+) comp19673_c0_seq1:67-2871(+)